MSSHRLHCLSSLVVSLLATSGAAAQTWSIDWFTIDSGGNGPGAPLTGGSIQLSSTIGQLDAVNFAAPGIEFRGGFWLAAEAPPCYANCDSSTASPILNINDFQCFLNRFAQNDSYANCDNSSAQPILNINDFQCFLNRFAAGCP